MPWEFTPSYRINTNPSDCSTKGTRILMPNDSRPCSICKWKKERYIDTAFYAHLSTFSPLSLKWLDSFRVELFGKAVRVIHDVVWEWQDFFWAAQMPWKRWTILMSLSFEYKSIHRLVQPTVRKALKMLIFTPHSLYSQCGKWSSQGFWYGSQMLCVLSFYKQPDEYKRYNYLDTSLLKRRRCMREERKRFQRRRDSETLRGREKAKG